MNKSTSILRYRCRSLALGILRAKIIDVSSMRAVYEDMQEVCDERYKGNSLNFILKPVDLIELPAALCQRFLRLISSYSHDGFPGFAVLADLQTVARSLSIIPTGVLDRLRRVLRAVLVGKNVQGLEAKRPRTPAESHKVGFGGEFLAP